MKEYDKRKSHKSSKIHVIYISSNNVRHPVTKTFTLLHPTRLHSTSLHFSTLHFHLNFTQLHFTTLTFGLTQFKFPNLSNLFFYLNNLKFLNEKFIFPRLKYFVCHLRQPKHCPTRQAANLLRLTE